MKKTMFTELMQRRSNFATQKLFELGTPIEGFAQVIVSCKPNGANGLYGSFFIHATLDGINPHKELDWDTDDCDYVHENVLRERIIRGRSLNSD